MKTRISTAMRSLWIVALLFVAQSAQAQAGFEGRIIQTISIAQLGDEKMEMVMNVKGDKLMISTDMGPIGSMKVYSVNGGKSMIMIMGPMGYEIDIPQGAENTKTVSASDKPAMKATGKKETINGYSAEEWTADIEDGSTMTMWLTSDIDKSLVAAMQTAMKAQNAQTQSVAQSEITRMLSEKGMIAVRTSMMKDGETALTMDLVKIEKATLPDSLFTPPADVKIQKMDPSMMQQGD
jgi:hypothetical protein